MSKLISVQIVGFNRDKMPKKGITILEITDIKKFMKYVFYVAIYFRDKDSCPFRRGNWIIDLYIKNEYFPSFCIKLPKEMTNDQIIAYAKPLVDNLEKRKRNSMN